MKHNYLKHLFTALLLVCCIGMAKAEEVTINGIKYDVVTETKKATVIRSGDYSGNIVIPSEITYNGVICSVTSIGYEAFYNSAGLTSVKIPNSVTSIGDYAFCYCKGLTSVVIGNGVTSIGYEAFWGCSGLTSITIPNSVTSIGYGAFDDTAWYNSQPDGVVYAGKVLYKYKGTMPSNTSITVKEGTLGIADYAFHNCDGLTSVEIPNSVTRIGGSAFWFCNRLTSIEIPNSVTSIGNKAFYNCWSLTSVEIPNSVRYIENGAFWGCTGLTSVTIPNSVTFIEENAFEDCSGLKEVHINDLAAWCGIDFVSNNANPLCYAKNLYLNGEQVTELVIPEGVTSIENYAFSGCTGLTSVVIPNSVTSIGNYAFYGCSGLTSVVIPNSVTSIGNYAFYGCTGLTSVVIPNSVTSIGSSAFRGCTGLTSITIPNSVTSIGSSAFSGCTGLTSVVIPNSVTSIGSSAFRGCTGLTSIEIPNSVTSIGSSAFDDTAWYNSQPDGVVYAGKVLYKYKGTMPSNTSITIKEGTLGIATGAFDGCTGLTSIEIPNSVTSIGSSTFRGCTGLTSIEIPNSVTSIGSYAFSSCTGLASIEIPNSVTSIGSYAFKGCSRLKAVINFSNLTFSKGSSSNGYIAYYADKVLNVPNGFIEGDFVWFENEGGMVLASYLGDATELTLPADYNGKSVISIGERAFYGCTGLTSIVIPSSVTSIGNNAFYGCTALETVINNSDLDIEKGSTSNGYVAYYANEVIANEFKFELVDGVYTLVKYRGKGIKQEETITFDSWTSTNKGQSSSTSSHKYTFDATAGSEFSFDWSVSSETNYDKLYVIFDGTTKLTKSGTETGNYEYSFTDAGSHTLEVKYTKDGSVDRNDDEAKIYNVKLSKTFYQPADVVLPDNYEGELYVIGESAFENNEFVASVTIPEGVEMICDKAFSGCSNLENIVIHNSVLAIGGDAFAGTKWYDNEEDGIVYAGNVLYKYKGTMPENTAITINDGTLGIAGLAFANCTGLTCIEIPASVTNIGNYAFDACTGLTSITSLIPAEDLFAIDSSVFSGVDKNACTLCVPYGAKETYAATAGWNVFVNIVELAPTDITVTINQYGNATYCSPFALDFSNVDGLKAYAATGYKSNSQVVTLTRVQTAKAGIGLFLKGEPGEYVVPTIEECNEHTLNLLVGTLEQTTVNSTDGAMSNYKFTIAEGDTAPMFYPFEDNTTLSAGKAYLQIPTAWLPATAQKSLNIRFDDGETTDIDELKGESGEVKTIYDLSGRVVENPTSGIYIINGKKVVVK